MNFQVRSFNPTTGAVTKTQLSATSKEQAALQVQASGQRVLSIQRQRSTITWLADENQHYSARHYPLFCRELRTLLVAGMGVVEAVDTLCDFDLRGLKSKGQKGPHLARALRERLQQGQSLSTALEAMPSVPPVLLAGVRSVEHTSNLLEALDDYLLYQDMMARLRSKMVSAAIYPAMVCALGVGITVFLLMVVMPQFAQMYKQLHGQAQGLSQVVISLSQWLTAHRWDLLMGCVAALAGLGWWWKSGKALETLAIWGWRVGWIRHKAMDYQLALFYQTLHLLSKGGYALVPALEIARTAAISTMLQDKVLRCRQEIEQGRSVSASLHRAGLANEVDRRLLAASEDNGEFSRVAQAVAQLHRTRFEIWIERLTRVVEPALLMLVALMVGMVVVVMYLPVFEMGALNR